MQTNYKPHMKHFSFFLFVVFTFWLLSCKEDAARKPKQQGKQFFYNELINKNKKLNAIEKQKLEFFIAKDTVNSYKASTKGYWYFYQEKDSLASITPETNDQIEIEFDIRNIANETIYKSQKRDYIVDKEDFIPALQDGVKRMKIGETITFLIPSYSAFGVSGDGYKIGVNESLISTVTLYKINKK